MNETKRWECCGVDWSEQVATAGEYTYCPRCGNRFPAPEAAPSEDERLAAELYDVADREDGHPVLEPWSDGVSPRIRKMWLAVLSKARSLLEPAAYARGKQDGRREAHNDFLEVAKIARIVRAWSGSRLD